MSGIQHEYMHNSITALAFYRTLSRQSEPLERGSTTTATTTTGTDSHEELGGEVSAEQNEEHEGQEDSFILVAEGPFVLVYNALSSQRVAQCRVFAAQVVHGIVVLDQSSYDNDSGEERAAAGSRAHVIKAALWGGKSYLLLSVSELDAVANGEITSLTDKERRAGDWVLDAAISPFEAPTGSPSEMGVDVAFVTAHSAVFQAVRGRGVEQNAIRLEALPVLSRSVLYSAHVVWTSSRSLTVAGGTVFGEVEVCEWRWVNGGGDGDDAIIVRGRHLGTFTGHEGSVFGVRISPEVRGRDGIWTRYLASCSDDRTIRVWDLSVSGIDENSPEREGISSPEVRDTGFREGNRTSMSDASVKRCIAVRMAHASRIWRVDFLAWRKLTSESPTKIHVLSFGEDATCHQWALQFSDSSSKPEGKTCHDTSMLGKSSIPSYPAVLAPLESFSYHSGKHIWSAALSFVSETSRRQATGGADGKVAVYDVFTETSQDVGSKETVNPIVYGTGNTKLQNFQAVSRNWTLADILVGVSHSNRILKEGSEHIETDPAIEEERIKGELIIRDTPNRYGFVGENELLTISSRGRVFLASNVETWIWVDLDVPENVRNDLKSYALLLGMPECSIAILAGANGTIYRYHPKLVTELMKVTGKPAALFDISASKGNFFGVLVTTLGSDTAHYVLVAITGIQSPKMDEVKLVDLPPGFIVTGAGSISGLLILGARDGSMALYDLENSREAIKVFHGQESQNDDAVTTVIAIPSTSQEDRFHFLTTSRNGCYSIYSLSITHDSEEHSKKISITLVHQAFPPLGPMIEAAWFDGPNLMLYGFRSKSFVVWNETKQCEVSSIECGGAHRSYAYMPTSQAGGAGHFAYTKASRLNIHSQTHPSHQTLKSGGHGREIKAAAVHGDFIATGAEDTTIRIWRILKEGGEEDRKVFTTVDGWSGKYGNTSLECCAVLEKHTTGIQHLQWNCSSEDHHSLFSAGGNEEFHVWAISDIPGFGVGVVCEATLTDLSPDRDLRIMGFDVQYVNDSVSRTIEERDRPRGKSAITLIYSDSTIKCYDYSPGLGFKKTAQRRYTTACLTQVVHLEQSQSGKKSFFTASTDGHLALWEHPPLPRHSSPYLSPGKATALPPPFAAQSTTTTQEQESALELELVLRLQLHQSSISALAIQYLTHIPHGGGGLLIATAGDDNALCVTFFYNLAPVKRIVVPAAHAAGISGLAFRGGDVTSGLLRGERYVQLWSVGGDQRVKRWWIVFDSAAVAADREEEKRGLEGGLGMRISRGYGAAHATGGGDGDDVWSSVADPGGLVEWRDDCEGDHVLVYGNGMEVWSLRDGVQNG